MFAAVCYSHLSTHLFMDRATMSSTLGRYHSGRKAWRYISTFYRFGCLYWAGVVSGFWYLSATGHWWSTAADDRNVADWGFITPSWRRRSFDGFSAMKLRNYYLLNPYESGEKGYKLLLTETDKDSLLALIKQRPMPENYSHRIMEKLYFLWWANCQTRWWLDPYVVG